MWSHVQFGLVSARPRGKVPTVQISLRLRPMTLALLAPSSVKSDFFRNSCARPIPGRPRCTHPPTHYSRSVPCTINLGEMALPGGGQRGRSVRGSSSMTSLGADEVAMQKVSRSRRELFFQVIYRLGLSLAKKKNRKHSLHLSCFCGMEKDGFQSKVRGHYKGG